MATVAATPRIAGRARALGMLSLAMLLAMAAWFSASALIPQLREEWALSPSTAAWLTIAVQLGFVTGAVVSAVFNVADVLPARRVFAASAIGAGVVNALLIFASGPSTAIPLRFLTGFLLAGVYPTGMKVLATWYRPEERGTALGILTGALALGTAMPHLVNGLGGLPWPGVVLESPWSGSSSGSSWSW